MRERGIGITNLGSAQSDGADLVRDVRSGLTSEPKDLSRWPKYFYDDEGSRLFERITAQPEYYQTRTELGILEERAEEIVRRTDCREIVELGSGSSKKTRTLIQAMLEHNRRERGSGATYSPLDVSEGILTESGERLLADYPDLAVHGYVGDFGGSVREALSGGSGSGGRLVVFLGGTVGNFVPEERTAFLKEIQTAMTPEDALLVGLDLVKDPAELEAAYSDAAGVTAAFNKNLLRVLNARLDADFDPDSFRHRAVYSEKNERIEMWLDSTQRQRVLLREADLAVAFEAGEGLRTELSHKFTPGSAREALARADLDLRELYTDRRERFALALAGRG